MPFSTGDKLGPYEILAPIGAGGMGEVYRARDPRLNRDVAIKFSKEQFSERFEREARTVAALNHPNICHLYDVGPNYLVMELIEGESPKGLLPLDDALKIARQIAEALEAAHEKGIVHRDLKPANIKITPDGTVKVLDFGLAKVAPASSGASEDSPTLTIGATQAGVILGTAAYMAPEQARGKSVDKRADIWAFGVVLYELLTGERPFKGEDVSEILAAVIKEEPSLDRVPLQVRPLLRRCLEKDRRKRLRDIGDLDLLLQPEPKSAATNTRSLAPWAIAAALLLVSTAASTIAWRATRPEAKPFLQLNLDLGDDAVLSGGRLPWTYFPAISPDGTRIAFITKESDGKTRLSTRLLATSTSAVLAGTEDAAFPFFSPDGQWLGFFSDAKLKKVALLGGSPVILCDIPATFLGGSWGGDGRIVFADAGGLHWIPPTGGTPQPITAGGSGFSLLPRVLPGSNAFLFTALPPDLNIAAASVQLYSFQSGKPVTLVHGGFSGEYVPSGHLIYAQPGGSLFAAPMDLTRLALAGPAVPVLDNTIGAEVSRTGAAIYLRTAGLEQERVAQFLGPSGKVQEIQLPSSAGSAPRVSPDGSQIAFIVEDKGKSDIWLYELANRRFSRLTFLGGVGAGFGLPAGAAWTPDGKHLLFSSSTPEKGIYWTRADGGGEPQRLVPQISAEVSIAPDEKRFAFVSTADDQKESEILIVPLDLTDPEHPKAGKPKVFLHGSYTIGVPRFSPDGHWIAYTSTESGRSEVYVRQFSPDGSQSGGKWQISTEGERGPPFWSHARKELFYTDPVGRMMVAGYEEKADSFDAGQPRIWSSSPTNLADLMPDGNRFLNVMLGISLQGKNPQVGFLVNFFDELHRRAPESK